MEETSGWIDTQWNRSKDFNGSSQYPKTIFSNHEYVEVEREKALKESKVSIVECCENYGR